MKPWSWRTLARATFATVLTVAMTLKASIGDGLDEQEWLDLCIAAMVAFGGWYGLGALPGPGDLTEPFLNSDKTSEQVPVPSPPAVPGG
jgi:hypothetical protein